MEGEREALFVFDFIGLAYFDKIIIYIWYFWMYILLVTPVDDNVCCIYLWDKTTQNSRPDTSVT